MAARPLFTIMAVLSLGAGHRREYRHLQLHGFDPDACHPSAGPASLLVLNWHSPTESKVIHSFSGSSYGDPRLGRPAETFPTAPTNSSPPGRRCLLTPSHSRTPDVSTSRFTVTRPRLRTVCLRHILRRPRHPSGRGPPHRFHRRPRGRASHYGHQLRLRAAPLRRHRQSGRRISADQ